MLKPGFRRLLIATLLIAIQALQAGGAQSQLPAMGDGADMSAGAERQIGDRIVRELYRDPDYLEDAILDEYVLGIWQALLVAARARGELAPELEERFAWTVLLGRDGSVNAFALPGGYLGLHLGLIGVVNSRDELASVLAHELAHVTQRHISRLMTQQNRQTPLMIGTLILAALAASKNPEMANAVLTGGQALAAQNQLNFSRDMEREADRIGFSVMTQAGFEARGYVSMFEKLQQASRLNDNGSFPYLRSHPLTTERIGDMQARIPLAAGGSGPQEPTMQHAMLAARARVLSYPGVDLLRAWANEPEQGAFATLSPPRRAAVLYAAALSAERLRDHGRATALSSAGVDRHKSGRDTSGQAAGHRHRAGGQQPGPCDQPDGTRRGRCNHAASGNAPTGPHPGAGRATGTRGRSIADLGIKVPQRCAGVAGAGGGLPGAEPVAARDSGRGRSADGAHGLRRRGGPIQGGPRRVGQRQSGSGRPHRSFDHRHPVAAG